MDDVVVSGTIGAGEIAELMRLVADATGIEGAPAVPFAAPLLLFTRLDDARREALFAPRPGRVLVQEQLAIEGTGRIPADEAVRVRFRFTAPGNDVAAFRIEAELCDAAGTRLSTVHTSIRPIEAASLATATGLPFPASPDASGVEMRPLGADLVGRWLRLVGDENPVHTDASHARGLGLAGPVVPGALLAAVAEAVTAETGSRLVRLNIRFMAPIPLGAAVTTRIREKTGGGDGRRDLRLFFLVGERATAVADLGYLRDGG